MQWKYITTRHMLNTRYKQHNCDLAQLCPKRTEQNIKPGTHMP